MCIIVGLLNRINKNRIKGKIMLRIKRDNKKIV